MNGDCLWTRVSIGGSIKMIRFLFLFVIIIKEASHSPPKTSFHSWIWPASSKQPKVIGFNKWAQNSDLPSVTKWAESHSSFCWKMFKGWNRAQSTKSRSSILMGLHRVLGFNRVSIGPHLSWIGLSSLKFKVIWALSRLYFVTFEIKSIYYFL